MPTSSITKEFFVQDPLVFERLEKELDTPADYLITIQDPLVFERLEKELYTPVDLTKKPKIVPAVQRGQEKLATFMFR